MPETAQSENPPERVMRQWYQAKLGERLLQAAQMAKDRMMLRRGAIKQQDGTLGTPANSQGENTTDTVDDPMNIRVGDEWHYHLPPAAQQQAAQTSPRSAAMSTVAKLALAAALLGSGGVVGAAVPWLAGMFAEQPTQEQVVPIDTNTKYETRLEIE